MQSTYAQLSFEQIKTLELGQSLPQFRQWLMDSLGSNLTVFSGNQAGAAKIESPKTDSVWVIKKNRPSFDKYGDCRYVFKFANDALVGLDIRFQFIDLPDEKLKFAALINALTADFAGDSTLVLLKSSDGTNGLDVDKIIARIMDNCDSEAANEDFGRQSAFLGSQAWEVHKRVGGQPRHKFLTMQVYTASLVNDYYAGCSAIVELSVSNEQFIRLFNQIGQLKIQYQPTAEE